MKTQLKIRTEYSFGSVYGPINKVVEALKQTGATSAGIVEFDGKTWGHVKFASACKDAGITPMFGAELIVRGEGDLRPTCWVLAEDTTELFRATTEGYRNKFWGATTTVEKMAKQKGLIRFAGSALSDPEAFDYVDVNPGSLLQRRKSLELAKRTSKPVVFTGDNHYPSIEHADLFSLIGKRQRMTEQHILPEAPSWVEKEWLRNADEIAERLKDVKLKSAPLIKVEGDIVEMARQGMRHRIDKGHIAEWTQEYESRLQHELKMIKEKDFESYFIVVADMIKWAKERMLVGPARGSSAGSLFCYLTEITEVDPIPHKLIFERFIDVTRMDLPDIDVDFPDSKRESVFEYMRKKYGSRCVARIGSVNTFKPNSALVVACKALGIPAYETAKVKDAMFMRSSGDSRANDCLKDTFAETEPGRELAAKYPELIPLLNIEGHASHSGIHAAGLIVCNDEVEMYATVEEGMIQLDKKDAEKLNLLKIDALGLRTLSVIEDSGVLKHTDYYDLKMDDPKVFELFNQRKFSGIFQWEGQALQSVTAQLHITKFSDLDHVTALARPGPLGGGAANRYIQRHEGREGFSYPHPSMGEYLDETFGLVIYQEQVLRLCREIGLMDWDQVTLLRKAMSKSYGKEYFDQFGEKFVAGAETFDIKKDTAWEMWDQINSMGSWAFNKAHSVSYATISYWTAWLKTHHQLAYVAAALRNAKDDESTVALLREVVSEGVEYIVFDIDKSEMSWSVQDGKLYGGFTNLVGFGPVKATQAIERRKLGTMTAKHIETITNAKRKFSELYPIRNTYASYYNDPATHGIADGWAITELADMADSGEFVVLGKMLSKDMRDENEAVRLQRRGGKRKSGPSKFVDFKVVDDSTTKAITIRVSTQQHEEIGEPIMNKAKEGDVFLIRGKKIPGYPILKVQRIKCITNEEMFNG